MAANEETRTSEPTPKASSFDGPGPFRAIVKGHLDSEYMGRLEVELLKYSTEGNTTDASGEKVIVSYLSPFYGTTPLAGASENDGFDYAQKSYGMWAVPPDVDSEVLVIFAEGNKSQGFWIGCIPKKFMNFMLPGNASTKNNTTDQSTILPVSEYNKKVETGSGNQPTTFLKPVNTDAQAILERAGLLNDQIRGTTTSSARREVPSMVFGMSTPGPLDRRPGKPTVTIGSTNSQISRPASRLTGSSFVMDDGDPSSFRKGPAATTPSVYASLADGGDPMLPANELLRLKTRTGHQILLHNTEDLIYIAHGSGQSWIEMTAQGTIEVYSKGNMSFHSDEDINFDAGKNINFKAGADINMIAANQMSTQTGANWDVSVGADGRLTCGGTSNIASAGHRETAGTINMNSGGAPAATASAASDPSVVPTGSGSETSSDAVAQEDTFGACVATEESGASNVDEPGDGLTDAERSAGAGAQVTSTPSRTNSGEYGGVGSSAAAGGSGPVSIENVQGIQQPSPEAPIYSGTGTAGAGAGSDSITLDNVTGIAPTTTTLTGSSRSGPR